MSKRAIGSFYFICLFIELFLTLGLIATIQSYNNTLQRIAADQAKLQSDQSIYGLNSGEALDDQGSLAGDQDQLPLKQQELVETVLIMAAVNILAIPAWIGTLVNLARARLWAWFALTFLFGGISIIIYLLAGPQPLKAGQAPQATVNSSPGMQPSPPAYQPQQSPLEVLQLRFARGEIDAATFQQMSEQLRASEGRHY